MNGKTIHYDGKVGVGTGQVHSNFKMQVQGGQGNWKGGIASGGAKAAVALGELNGKATIGGHSADLNAWADLLINPDKDKGKVGIGTTTPSEKLEVKGTIAVDGADSFVLLQGGNKGTSGAPTGKYPLRLFEGWGWNFTLQDDKRSGFRVGPSSAGSFSKMNYLTVSDGGVGIGTSSVHTNFRMQVQGGSGSWKGGIASGGAKATVALGELNGKATIGGHNSSLNAWADLLINPHGNNVGIGTTTPSEKLEVKGNIKLGENKFLSLKNGKNGDPSLISSEDNSWLRIGSKSSICFWTDGNAETNESPQVEFKRDGKIKCAGLDQPSDKRWKKDIKPIANALQKVLGLQGVTYTWKDTTKGKDTQIGLIAQEVEAIFPEVVTTDDQGYKSLDYGKIVAPLIEAIKAQQRQIDALQKEVLKTQ